MQTKIAAMLIMARERRLPLLEALESCGIDVLPVCNPVTSMVLDAAPKWKLTVGASNIASNTAESKCCPVCCCM